MAMRLFCWLFLMSGLILFVGCGDDGREEDSGTGDVDSGAPVDMAPMSDACVDERPGCPCSNPRLGCYMDTPITCNGTEWVEDEAGLGCSSLCDVAPTADGCPCEMEGELQCSITEPGYGTECIDGIWTELDDTERCPEAP